MATTPPPPIYTRQRNLAHALISKYGISAILRRSTGDHPCIVFLSTSPHEQSGNLINQVTRYALLSPIGLTIEPDSEQDKLVTLDPETGLENETLRVIAPIGKLAPADIVIYWRLQVRR